MMTQGGNPFIGILLCTQRDYTLMEYALAGMDNGLFVSKYQQEDSRHLSRNRSRRRSFDGIYGIINGYLMAGSDQAPA